MSHALSSATANNVGADFVPSTALCLALGLALSLAFGHILSLALSPGRRGRAGRRPRRGGFAAPRRLEQVPRVGPGFGWPVAPLRERSPGPEGLPMTPLLPGRTWGATQPASADIRPARQQVTGACQATQDVNNLAASDEWQDGNSAPSQAETDRHQLRVNL